MNRKVQKGPGWHMHPPVLVMDRRQIPREERHLEAQFGAPYLRYKAQVRRWR